MYYFLLVVALATVANGKLVSRKEFNQAITSNGFPEPSKAQYDGYIASLEAGKINDKMEAAMFLAQLLHNSGGLRYKEEQYCTTGGNPCDVYQTGDWNPDCPAKRPGKRYYGRGYIQIAYCSNYRAASLALGLGEELADDPDLVAEREDISWKTAAWFWGENVHGELEKNPSAFGISTKLINGQIEECQGNGKNADKSQARFKIYTNVFKVFRLRGKPNAEGCSY